MSLSLIKNRGWWCLLVLCILCIVAMQFGSIPGGDELSYAFEGQRDSHILNPHRVASIMDIVHQQWKDYHFRGNGRVILHSIVAFSSWHGLWFFARALTVGMWFLLVYLILLAGGMKRFPLAHYLYGFLLTYWFVFYSEVGGGNFAFSINYVWSPCIMLGMLFAWRRINNAVLVPLAFLFGWTQEVFVLPFLGTAITLACYDWIVLKKKALNMHKIFAWIAMLVSACFLCFGPASRSRAGGLGNGLFVTIIESWGHLLLLGTPALMLGILGFIVIRKNKALIDDEDSRWWWVYFAFSILLYSVVSKDAYLRTATGWFVAGTVIIIRNRDLFSLRAVTTKILSLLVIVWMCCAALLQGYIGYCSYRMANLYREDSQGIACYPTIWLGPFMYTVGDRCCDPWYLYHFMLFYGKSEMPSVLEKKVYANIYADTRMSEMKALEIPDCFVLPDMPAAVFKHGSRALTDDEKRAIELLINVDARPKWMRKVPFGRVANMFPIPRNHLRSKPFHFVNKRGEEWTVYSK